MQRDPLMGGEAGATLSAGFDNRLTLQLTQGYVMDLPRMCA
jgi:hypothetical protein